ncbi:MAG: HD domain-containing protein [Phycisphaerales bacterium]|jgi:3'-5' exoribonuclease|nr:HD domain-containing protein [Phycisphaerales bacterium]MDP6311224.1 HD domain-containing protein [Phycisphaerales bacterium]MDP7086383.1 HD domain-containing protein [Phycisphaerales bacterium]MDP7189331.1 HD domain-containing protein [Phycisphaerales bacterium]MDP7519993.1 HD domain-containing protein [Phycisphaerales bacterium]|tara:strand:+ start:635 stop:1516 length:882 start_codon:yes stop_codon:yes gene_type:complete
MSGTIEPGQTLSSEPFLLVNPQLGTSRSGGAYLRCLLRNAGGQVSGRGWSFDASQLATLKDARAVSIDGHVVDWQGSPQVNIESIEPFEADHATLLSLMPVSSGDNAAMFGEVEGMLRRLDDPSIRGLAEAYLDDGPLMQRFREAPAGVSKHHACIGGLLEHTLQVMRLIDVVVATYQDTDVELDRDILMLGAFLHDLGKTEELDWSRGFSYTVDGNLVGHIVRGAIMLEEKASEAELAGSPAVPELTLRHLQHLILSHHELPEYGAAKRPVTPEAKVLCLLDRLDATLNLVE